MRIIAGRLRHRIIKMTNLETTRETQDKVRQAIFTMLGTYFDGGKCLDLFAGSGAMAIEAYSRGFDSIYMNDINRNALMVCKDNCNSLGIKDAYFYNMDYKEFVNSTNELFDMIILDPPYKMNQIDEILESVYKLLSFKGMIVFEMDKNSIYPKEYNDLKIYKNKEYGIKRVVVYKR